MAYPYTYLAAFMNPDFRLTVTSTAIRELNRAPGSLRQRLDRAVRAAGVSAPGYRPGKIPLNQVARPLATPISRNSPVTPFTSSEEIAYSVFSLWLGAKTELREKVAAFLQEKGLPVQAAQPEQPLPEGGLEGTLKGSEMEQLAAELGASSETDSAAYDDTALMLVLLMGRAPVGEEEGEAEAAEQETAPQTDESGPAEVNPT